MAFQQSFMEMALDEAMVGSASGSGGPFGCVIVKNGEVVGRGHNSVILLNDPTAHAEVMAIRHACDSLGDFQLTGCELYTTCEPCPMCLGAIYWARPDRVYYGTTRHDAAQAGFDDEVIYYEIDLEGEKRRIPMHLKLDLKIREMMQNWYQDPDHKLY